MNFSSELSQTSEKMQVNIIDYSGCTMFSEAR
jgi:hypothetical protein